METSLSKSILIIFALVPMILDEQKAATSETHPFGNSHLSTEERFQDLLNRLTIEENHAQLVCR